jgi:putative ABC transport system permease protein
MNRWLGNFAYKTILSWWIFALAGIGVSILTLLTVSWQSWKAANINPIICLKVE